MHRRSAIAVLSSILFALTLSAEAAESIDSQAPSPTLAALRSLILPGWGQIINGKPLKALIYGGIEEALIYGVYRQHKLYQFSKREGLERDADFYRNDRNRLTWYLAGTMILSMMDAYVDAHLSDFDIAGSAVVVSPAQAGWGVRLGWSLK